MQTNSRHDQCIEQERLLLYRLQGRLPKVHCGGTKLIEDVEAAPSYQDPKRHLIKWVDLQVSRILNDKNQPDTCEAIQSDISLNVLLGVANESACLVKSSADAAEEFSRLYKIDKCVVDLIQTCQNQYIAALRIAIELDKSDDGCEDADLYGRRLLGSLVQEQRTLSDTILNHKTAMKKHLRWVKFALHQPELRQQILKSNAAAKYTSISNNHLRPLEHSLQRLSKSISFQLIRALEMHRLATRVGAVIDMPNEEESMSTECTNITSMVAIMMIIEHGCQLLRSQVEFIVRSMKI